MNNSMTEFLLLVKNTHELYIEMVRGASAYEIFCLQQLYHPSPVINGDEMDFIKLNQELKAMRTY